MYLVISLLVLRAGCGISLYQFLIIAYLFTFHYSVVSASELELKAHVHIKIMYSNLVETCPDPPSVWLDSFLFLMFVK